MYTFPGTRENAVRSCSVEAVSGMRFMWIGRFTSDLSQRFTLSRNVMNVWALMSNPNVRYIFGHGGTQQYMHRSTYFMARRRNTILCFLSHCPVFVLSCLYFFFSVSGGAGALWAGGFERRGGSEEVYGGGKTLACSLEAFVGRGVYCM